MKDISYLTNVKIISVTHDTCIYTILGNICKPHINPNRDTSLFDLNLIPGHTYRIKQKWLASFGSKGLMEWIEVFDQAGISPKKEIEMHFSDAESQRIAKRLDQKEQAEKLLGF